MKLMRKLLTAGLVTGFCLTPIGISHAATVLGLELKDVGSNFTNVPGSYLPILDGVAGAFIVYTPLDIQTFNAASTFTGDLGTGTILGEGAENLPYSFSSGTTYESSSVEVYTFGNGMVADISDGMLTFSSLDFGLNIVPSTVEVPPDPGSLIVNWLVQTGTNTYDVSFMWTTVFPLDPLDTGISNVPYHVYLEGTMTTSPVPLPAAVWLFGGGLISLLGFARRK